MSDEPRILVADIETAPIEAYTWGLWDQNIGLEQIKCEWTILAYCAKWLGSKDVIYQDTSGRGSAKVRDDSILLDNLWNLLDECDILVTQNGVKFDVRKINARLVMHGYGPYSPIRVVDTLTVAKKYFGFTSNKLAWMSKYLTDTKKSDHRRFPGFELWIECLKDNPKAWAEMKAYNIKDTVACEELYLQLRPWITNHPNMGTYRSTSSGKTKEVCPKCGSAKLQKRGVTITQAGQYQRWQCQGCSGWSRSKTTILPTEKRKALLV